MHLSDCLRWSWKYRLTLRQHQTQLWILGGG